MNCVGECHGWCPPELVMLNTKKLPSGVHPALSTMNPCSPSSDDRSTEQIFSTTGVEKMSTTLSSCCAVPGLPARDTMARVPSRDRYSFPAGMTSLCAELITTSTIAVLQNEIRRAIIRRHPKWARGVTTKHYPLITIHCFTAFSGGTPQTHTPDSAGRAR